MGAESGIPEASKMRSSCREVLPLWRFARDASRIDGRTYWCCDCRNAKARERYNPRCRPSPGRRYVAARDGDRQQARRRIDHLIAVGEIPDPNDVACIDCGHVWSLGERRHEYDHHKGYAAEHHEDVEPVCTTCHHDRERARRASGGLSEPSPMVGA